MEWSEDIVEEPESDETPTPDVKQEEEKEKPKEEETDTNAIHFEEGVDTEEEIPEGDADKYGI